jgi:hypothetical protein
MINKCSLVTFLFVANIYSAAFESTLLSKKDDSKTPYVQAFPKGFQLPYVDTALYSYTVSIAAYKKFIARAVSPNMPICSDGLVQVFDCGDASNPKLTSETKVKYPQQVVFSDEGEVCWLGIDWDEQAYSIKRPSGKTVIVQGAHMYSGDTWCKIDKNARWLISSERISKQSTVHNIYLQGLDLPEEKKLLFQSQEMSNGWGEVFQFAIMDQPELPKIVAVSGSRALLWENDVLTTIKSGQPTDVQPNMYYAYNLGLISPDKIYAYIIGNNFVWRYNTETKECLPFRYTSNVPAAMGNYNYTGGALSEDGSLLAIFSNKVSMLIIDTKTMDVMGNWMMNSYQSPSVIDAPFGPVSFGSSNDLAVSKPAGWIVDGVLEEKSLDCLYKIALFKDPLPMDS